MKLTAFEEDELTKKWQEILGPSNEVVVREYLSLKHQLCILGLLACSLLQVNSSNDNLN